MFYFIRHGETDYNLDQLWMGRKDLPLNQKGVRQSEAAAKTIARLPIQLVMTSPLLRARQTAELIATRHPDSPAIQIANWLTERDFGPFEGVKKTEASRSKMNGSKSVESMECLAMRLKPIEEAMETYPHLLIVAHSGVYRCLVECLGFRSPCGARGLGNAELVSLTR